MELSESLNKTLTWSKYVVQSSIILEIWFVQGNVVKKEEAGWREEGEEGWRDDEPRDWGRGVDRIYLNVVEEDCIVSQSEVYIQEKGEGEDQVKHRWNLRLIFMINLSYNDHN